MGTTQQPIGAATAQSSCPVLHASITQKVEPGILVRARILGFHLPKTPTILDVLVDASGKPTKIRLVQSSDNANLHNVAMRVAAFNYVSTELYETT